MTYFLAPALVRLRDEVDAVWPARSKASDGWIGDTSHAARASDHNPSRLSPVGIVRAIDVTNAGIDVDAFIARVIADPRTAYVISRGRIWQNPAVYRNGGWLNYSGANKHDHHVHVSVRHGAGFDSTTSAWGVSALAATNGEGAMALDSNDKTWLTNEMVRVVDERVGFKLREAFAPSGEVHGRVRTLMDERLDERVPLALRQQFAPSGEVYKRLANLSAEEREKFLDTVIDLTPLGVGEQVKVRDLLGGGRRLEKQYRTDNGITPA